ncbi:hypothetical protein F5878DRAFT_667761 [Lentinula raphanica]|uniref:Uncharacterized protein n=1 Tax=Lentinula raphanica TaxID=153919 RepID=A0AA38NV88_9AGAR|nr:hypothetical protein F5878DRAFT_667761 [Lentinula raphanica]
MPQTQRTTVRVSESSSTNGSDVPGTGLNPNSSQPTSLPSTENVQSAATPQNGQQPKSENFIPSSHFES